MIAASPELHTETMSQAPNVRRSFKSQLLSIQKALHPEQAVSTSLADPCAILGASLILLVLSAGTRQLHHL